MVITQEMARTMLMDSKLTDIFWTHVVHTTVHIQNRVILRKKHEQNFLRAMERNTNKCKEL